MLAVTSKNNYCIESPTINWWIIPPMEQKIRELILLEVLEGLVQMVGIQSQMATPSCREGYSVVTVTACIFFEVCCHKARTC